MTEQQAQEAARDLLTTAFGETVTGTIVLSDDDEATSEGQHVTTPSRLESAADQYRMILGESLDTDAIVGALRWL